MVCVCVCECFCGGKDLSKKELACGGVLIEKRNILVYYCLQNILIAIVSYETINSVNAIVIPILQMKTLRLRV